MMYIYIYTKSYMKVPPPWVRFMHFPCSAGDYTVRNFVGVIEDGFPDGEESVGWCLLGIYSGTPGWSRNGFFAFQCCEVLQPF